MNDFMMLVPLDSMEQALLALIMVNHIIDGQSSLKSYQYHNDAAKNVYAIPNHFNALNGINGQQPTNHSAPSLTITAPP